MKKNICWIVIIFLFQVSGLNASEYKWELKENKITVAQRIGINEKYLAQVFILDYAINSQCVAFVSILSIANSKVLGKKTKEDIYKSNSPGNQLRFIIDNKEVRYTQEKIIKVEYENGVEFGTLAPLPLITALQKGSGKLEVFLGETNLLRIPGSVGFSEANKRALEYCMRLKR